MRIGDRESQGNLCVLWRWGAREPIGRRSGSILHQHVSQRVLVLAGSGLTHVKTNRLNIFGLFFTLSSAWLAGLARGYEDQGFLGEVFFRQEIFIEVQRCSKCPKLHWFTVRCYFVVILGKSMQISWKENEAGKSSCTKRRLAGPC